MTPDAYFGLTRWVGWVKSDLIVEMRPGTWSVSLWRTFGFLIKWYMTRTRGPLPIYSNMTSLLIITDALYRKCTRYKTLWLRFPPLSFCYYLLSIVTRQMLRNWEIRNTNIQSHRLTITGYYSNWLFMNTKNHSHYKTLTLVRVPTMITCPICPLKWRLFNLVMVKSHIVNWLTTETFGIIKPFQTSCNRMIVLHLHFGKCVSVLALVY